MDANVEVTLEKAECPSCKKEVNKLGSTLVEHVCFRPVVMKDDGCAVVKCPKCKKNVVKVGQKMMGHKCVMVLRPNAVIKPVVPPKPQKQQKCVLMKCPLCDRDVLQVNGKSTHSCYKRGRLLRLHTFTSSNNLGVDQTEKRFKCSLCQKDLVKSGGKILGHECKVNEPYVIPDEHIQTSVENLKFSTFSEPQSSEVKSVNPAFIQTNCNQSQIYNEEKCLSCDGLRDISCHHHPKTKGHLDDSFVNTNQSCINNVDSWVKEQMDKGVVRFYKPKGSLLHSHPDLSENDLMIMILNEAQCTMLKQYSADCVCIDVTKELKNDFELVTLMVLDEQGQGLPCCFMLTNRVDSKTMEILFNVIKTVVGYSIEASVLVTDVSPVFWSAWNVVMRCVPLNWLFSTWQVDATWRKNIESLISSVDKRTAVQKALTNLYLAADEMTFTHLLGSTLEEWGLDQDTADFSSYFISEFSHNVTNWAYCYRKHLGENKILHLEMLHTVLGSIQQLGTQSNGLDSFIMDLMKFINDNFKISTNSVISGDQCIETTSKVDEIKRKHREARSLKISQVAKTIKGWSLSDRSDNVNHKVTVCDLTCDCKLKCDLCSNICLHSYKCSCPDSNSTMCSHVHYLAMNGYFGNQLEQSVEQTSSEGTISVVFNSSDLGVDFFVPGELEARSEPTTTAISSLGISDTTKPQLFTLLPEIPSRKRPHSQEFDVMENRKQMLRQDFQQILDCANTSEDLDALENLLKPYVPTKVEPQSTLEGDSSSQIPEDKASKTIQKNEDRRSSIS